MNYTLIDIIEQQVVIRLPDHPDGQGALKVNWNFVLDFRFPTPLELAVRVTATLDSTAEEERESLFELDVVHRFRLGESPSFYPIDFNTPLTDEGKVQLATFVGICVGTARGLAYTRTAAPFGKEVLIPVLNPTAMLEHHIAQVISQSEDIKQSDTSA